MFSRKNLASAGVFVVAVSAASLVAATSANAVVAKTYNVVAPGVAVNQSLTVTGTVSNPTITDLTSSAPIKCPFINVGGTTTTRAQQAVATAAANVTSASFDSSANPCKVSTFTTLAPAVASGFPWPLKITTESTSPVPAAATTAPVLNQETRGTISNIQVVVKESPSGCSSTIGGSYTGTFKNTSTNSTIILASNTTDSALTVTASSNGSAGCFGGLVKPGDKIGIGASLKVAVSTASANPLWVNAKG